MTKPVKVLSQWDRFKRWTVWHPINTDPADENRWGPRFWFPSYDVIALFLGLYAFHIGSPMLNRLFPSWLTDGMGFFLIFASITCFAGVVFPRFNYLELGGKLLIVFILGAYAGTVFFMSRTDEPNGFVVIVLIMAVWLLGPRISVLFVQVPRNKDVIRFLAWKKRAFPRKKK